jgi:hypothetical protein
LQRHFVWASRWRVRFSCEKAPQKILCKITKHPFTILELSIAFSLIATIVFFLLIGTRNFLLFEKKIEIAKEEVQEHLHVQIRLEHIFSQLIPSSFIPNATAPLYTSPFPKEKEKSLVCIFDNGLDPDPKFSGPVLSRIFLSNQEIHLVIWPLEKDGSIPNVWREEMLLTGIDTFSFAFFTKEKKSTQSFWTWLPDWPEEKNELPLMIRLSTQKKGKETLFAFFPPFAQPISYEAQQ